MNIANPIHTFKFVQGNADLSGGEFTVDVHPHPFHWLHFKNSFGYVLAVQQNATDSTKYLPFTPAPKFSFELKAEKNKAGQLFRNVYVMVGVDSYFKQDKIYSAFDTETETPAYTLIHTGMGTEVASKGKILFSLYISVNNLTDVAYQNHLSRLKYGAENYATGRKGVYNMGRNISVKLIVPVGLKKPKE